MNFEEYKIEFSKKASNAGYSEANIQRCLSYAEMLFKNKVPVIYNTSHLSALVGYKKDYLKKAITYTSHFYRDFEISKRNKKKRTISEPLPSLKEIQHWILNNILSNVPVSLYAKAYRSKTTLIENVKFHKKQSILLTFDIKDFFPSIKIQAVEEIFRSMGYSSIISNLLAKLCTKDGELPQGAPTSPYLSNLFFKEVDEEISKYCLAKKIRFTRYADDLAFSGDFDHKELSDIVIQCVEKKGLKINEEKTKLMLPYERQIVTGVVVNNKHQVPFYKRNKLRQEMFYIKKFGIENCMKHQKIQKANYLEHLLGQINFILQMNSTDKEFISYKEHLLLIKHKQDNSTY